MKERQLVVRTRGYSGKILTIFSFIFDDKFVLKLLLEYFKRIFKNTKHENLLIYNLVDWMYSHRIKFKEPKIAD